MQQQFAFRFRAVAIDQDAQAAQFFQLLAMVRQAAVDQFIVRFNRVLEIDTRVAHALHGCVDIVRAQRDVLDAFAMVLVQVFGDLRLVVRRFIDRDANLAAGRSHGLRLEARQLAFDVEIAHFAEVEQAFIEAGPFLHAATVHIVRQVVDVRQAMADGVGDGAGNGDEVDVIDADVADAARCGGAFLVGALAAPAVDEVQQGIAHALDGGDVELHRAGFIVEAPGAQFQRAAVHKGRVVDADGDGAHGRAVMAGKTLRERILFGIDDEIDVALAVQGHILVAVARDGREAHVLEQLAQCFWVWCCILDELETIGTHRVIPRLKLHDVSSKK